jgi:hypothetical protein
MQQFFRAAVPAQVSSFILLFFLHFQWNTTTSVLVRISSFMLPVLHGMCNQSHTAGLANELPDSCYE